MTYGQNAPSCDPLTKSQNQGSSQNTCFVCLKIIFVCEISVEGLTITSVTSNAFQAGTQFYILYRWRNIHMYKYKITNHKKNNKAIIIHVIYIFNKSYIKCTYHKKLQCYSQET